jgi:hypothetical protein
MPSRDNGSARSTDEEEFLLLVSGVSFDTVSPEEFEGYVADRFTSFLADGSGKSSRISFVDQLHA